MLNTDAKLLIKAMENIGRELKKLNHLQEKIYNRDLERDAEDPHDETYPPLIKS